MWVLDNEISNDLKQSFKINQTNYQLVPPHSHLQNLAERAIQTWKNHFKAGLASADPNFPLTAWDHVIPQENITLNPLRNARSNPALLAYAYVYGNFNFLATPLAPPGTKVVIHLNPSIQGTWELNGDIGWYVGPALDHYHCVKCYFPRTRTTRICETVTFFPHAIPFPQVLVSEHLKQAAEDIVTLLQKPLPTTIPSLTAGDPVYKALRNVAATLNRIEEVPLPRVNEKTSNQQHALKNNVQSPRVQKEDKNTPFALHHQPKTPKNIRYRNDIEHRYPLRSRVNLGTNFKSLAVNQLVAEQLFQFRASHIYRPDGKKETIDTLLRGSDRKYGLRASAKNGEG